MCAGGEARGQAGSRAVDVAPSDDQLESVLAQEGVGDAAEWLSVIRCVSEFAREGDGMGGGEGGGDSNAKHRDPRNIH